MDNYFRGNSSNYYILFSSTTFKYDILVNSLKYHLNELLVNINMIILREKRPCICNKIIL